MAVILIKSKLWLEELTDYYNKIDFKPAKNNDTDNEEIDIDIEKVTDKPFIPDYCRTDFFSFEYLKNEEDFKDLYYVAIHNGTHSAPFDLRGA